MKYDERQLQARGRIGNRSLALAMILLMVLASAQEFGLLNATPLAAAHTVLWTTLSYFCVAAIRSDAYLERGMKWPPILAVFGGFIFLYVVVAVKNIAKGTFFPDGKLDTEWSMLMMLVFFVITFSAGLWKSREERTLE
ncbi:hypothetical protein WG936_04905 [Corynebacterium sp. H127]|uniref:hypothetical protein n=1 Tax=Corynebacterium sp. H127 TaxID=3133418 RepID=UPI00309569CC